jgi:hypothetical protein
LFVLADGQLGVDDVHAGRQLDGFQFGLRAVLRLRDGADQQGRQGPKAQCGLNGVHGWRTFVASGNYPCLIRGQAARQRPALRSG